MNKEFLKMQKLAGLITESEFKEKLTDPTFDLDNEIYPLSGNPDNLEELKQIIIKGIDNIIKHVADQFGTNIADDLYMFVEKIKMANDLKTLGELYSLIQDFLYENTDVYTNDLGVGKKSPKHHEYGNN
jgi:hypothetical protein